MKTTQTVAMVTAVAMFISSKPLCASATDDLIESSFRKSYAYQVYLKDDAMKTESRNGVVTLSGQVNEASHKYLAQETVSSQVGVQGVDDRLEVKLKGTEKSDAWIQANVRSLLALHRNVGRSVTQVDIRDGVITLRGVATSEAQKELATVYAEDVNGVLRVTNAMSVTKLSDTADDTVPETIDDASITAQVRVALRLHQSTSFVINKVETIAGVVTVTGLARNTNERTMVTKLGADIRGVRSVVNHLNVGPPALSSGIRPSRVSNLRLVSPGN